LSDTDTAAPVRNRKIMSDKTRDDLASCVLGFEELCQMWFKKFPGTSLYQYRLNSDVLENSFCQQRGLHNGANTNPNLITYAKTNNSITLGQATLSKKGNACGEKQAAQSFKISTPGPLRARARKRQVTKVAPYKSKLIRL
jgi:hypothetical protein